jgi:hypothetical protein
MQCVCGHISILISTCTLLHKHIYHTRKQSWKISCAYTGSIKSPGCSCKLQQGRLSYSFASLIFLGLIIGRKFSKLRQSTAFYWAQRTRSGTKAILSGTYFFFASKLERKLSKSEVQNNILKIISARKKVKEIFLLDYPSIIPSLNYDWKWVWGSVSAVPWWYFSRFLLILSSRFVRWHGHNFTTRNRGPSKVVSFDSEGLSYSTKVPSDLFLTYGIMFKKKPGAKEDDSRPCCMYIVPA